MISALPRVVLGAALLWLPLMAGAQLHHSLTVSLDPEAGTIEVEDRISLDGEAASDPVFSLHPALTPELVGASGHLIELASQPGPDVPDGEQLVPRRYRAALVPGETQFTLRYRGRIRHALQQQGEEYARGFRETHGVIGPQGVFLSAASYWYPRFGAALLDFDLQVRLPPDWRAITQGERIADAVEPAGVYEHWRCRTPQEEIYLVAGRFTAYRRPADGVEALVLLREPDAALAARYLDATATYLDLYTDLIGPYPYTKFALVENFWETGYGMPSFTLLGSKVIRLPFILHSSYPHEILHNWWGNGVYVDYAKGNWAEGLTSYLADHLIKEQRGQGSEYRRNVLQKYTDYVRAGKDFPLTAFRSRHSASSEAVGYGKSLMLFHMLRRQLGDATFIAGLRALYAQYRFRVADFPAVRDVFGAAAQQPLDDFFEQWVERTGAPELRLSEVRVQGQGDGYLLRALLEQTQAGPPYTLRVPLAVQLEGRAAAWQAELTVDAKRSPIELELPAQPLVLHVDPEFDVFRRLHRAELPPALSQALGAERVLVVLPAQAPAPLLAAYRALAESWRAGNPDFVSLVTDTQIERLPTDRTVWLFGWRNRFRAILAEALAAYAFTDEGERVRIGETELTRKRHGVVVMARQPDNPEQALGWLAAEQPGALPGLGRKLPHYGRYSYLGFSGTEPENVFKGVWSVVDSPLTVRLVPASVELPPMQLAPRRPLAAVPGRFSRTHLQRDATVLAGAEMEGRGLRSAGIEQAAEYIAAQFRDAGLQPGGDGTDSFFQVWRERVDALGDTVTLKNVIGILPGSDSRLAGESLVIGAHFDHFGYGEYADYARERGRLHPGADDNASGVAVLLEMARVLGAEPQPRTVVFVAFSAEETGRLGSRHYVENPGAYPVDKATAMLNLDSVGRLGARPVTVFGSGTAEQWPHILRGAGYVTGVPVRPVADDFGSSDQSSFIEAGVPALQFFGGVHADLHRPGDTPDKLDIDGMRKVAELLYEVVVYLAVRSDRLGPTLAGTGDAAPSVPPGKRRVRLGTVPDFAFEGEGVRLAEVGADSPAASAGLQAGDVIIAVNGAPVQAIRDYATALRRLEPGDEIRVRVRRDGQEQTVTTRVIER